MMNKDIPSYIYIPALLPQDERQRRHSDPILRNDRRTIERLGRRSVTLPDFSEAHRWSSTGSLANTCTSPPSLPKRSSACMSPPSLPKRWPEVLRKRSTTISLVDLAGYARQLSFERTAKAEKGANPPKLTMKQMLLK